MSLLPRLCLMLALLGLASGCQTGASAPGAGDVTPNAVAGDPIRVTALDASPTSAAPVAAEALATATAQVSAPAVPETVAPVETPRPAQDAAVATAGRADDAGVTGAAEAVPAPSPKSERQIACERKRGAWADTGGGLKICVLPTRDGGKRCTRESQCDSVCLARSQTCAPVQPLLGCNEILQDDGARVKLCIE